PELSRDEVLSLPRQSPLPLGFVTSGLWPLGISRILAEAVQTEEPYLSPHRESLFVKPYGQNNWIFPGWELDFSKERKELERAGYRIFVTLQERWPKKVHPADRTSNFNWDNQLL
ncbi:MAG: U32 family peptidase, partial [Proteobacteria bacterium]|nr:U32 family peptidase [Pseudomonadota bacterium]MBU1612305.1 U32 family peptidase [Pseudomonadota bacterium]